jgi:hypothetical protein
MFGTVKHICGTTAFSELCGGVKPKEFKKVKKSKTIPVTGCGGPCGCDPSRLPTLYGPSAHRWRLGCQPFAPAALYPQKDSQKD